MLIIDLRPYEEQKQSKPLQTLLDEHLKQIRGSSLVIYSKADKIIVTPKQYELLNSSIVGGYGFFYEEIEVLVRDGSVSNPNQSE